jgi:hypothetical protein
MLIASSPLFPRDHLRGLDVGSPTDNMFVGPSATRINRRQIEVDPEES